MEIAKKITKHLCRLTLMWVMLLWAFTLPGHEVAVYDFLLTGTQPALTGDRASTASEGTVTIKAQAVTAFADAKPASGLTLVPQKMLGTPAAWLPAAFSNPKQEALPTLALKPVSAPLLARLVPVTIQPNAP